MKKQTILNLFTLRIVVGALGEIIQPAWWMTSFMNPTSQMFLSPVFTRMPQIAQYQGVRESACRQHDEFIGTGKVYHLFRLPEVLEYEIQNFALTQPSEVNDLFRNADSFETLLDNLAGLAGVNKKSAATGPVRAGDVKDLMKSAAIENLAQYYLAGFQENRKIYPYFSDEN